MIFDMTDYTAGPGAGTAPPSPPPPPPFSPPPPPPPSYGSPYGPPYTRVPKHLHRSLTNRRIAGVAGGLGDYLGVDATALRLGFVIVSVLFLGGIGGLLVYVGAWIFIPEEGRGTSGVQNPFAGRPWQAWDRSARSWALVLGSLTLALVWSFGFWPWWHWRALPALLAVGAVALWAFTRSRPAGWGQGQPSGTGPGPTGATSGTAGTPFPPGRAGAPGASGPVASATGPVGTANDMGPEAADWAVAQSTAASWAEAQLAAAGVRAAPPPPRPVRSRATRGVGAVLVAVFLGLLLCAVLMVVSVTLGSGSSLRGGVGRSTFDPQALSDVTSHYRLGAGNLDVNLSAVTFPAKGKTIDVTVGMGRLTVEVPENADVTVDAHVGMGQVDVFGQSTSGVQVQGPAHAAPGGGAHDLTLEAHVGMGDIQVTRG
jgi:phage shock protein PspC (stress-responsive transcriptional regulator)